MNKKGQADADAGIIGTKIVSFIFVIIFVVFPVAIILGMAAYNYQSAYRYLDPKVERELYLERALNCFAQYDKDIDRYYPIVDIEKANMQNMKTCFSGDLGKGVRVLIQDAATQQEKADLTVWTQDLPIHRTSHDILYLENAKINKGVMHLDLS